MAEAVGSMHAWGAGSPRRADAYLFAGFTLAALLASISIVARDAGFARGALLAVAPSLLFGVLAVAARYPSRAIPLTSTRWTLLAGVHLAAASAASFLWALSWGSWGRILGAAGVEGSALERRDFAAAFGTGVLLYLIAVIAQYLLIEIDRSDAARRAALRSELAAREAELKAFKAQIDPHFLFNSLNAIASLCGSRPDDARIMSQQLADFFRQTLRVARRERIRLDEEVELARRYLEIERTRFGARLASQVSVEPDAGGCGIPPLLLQPLVENAVRHGIASLVEGGTVAIEATVAGGRLRIRVANPADPDRPPGRGEGIGLANVRGRIEAAYGPAASLLARESDGTFEAVVTLEAEPLAREDA